MNVVITRIPEQKNFGTSIILETPDTQYNSTFLVGVMQRFFPSLLFDCCKSQEKGMCSIVHLCRLFVVFL